MQTQQGSKSSLQVHPESNDTTDSPKIAAISTNEQKPYALSNLSHDTPKDDLSAPGGPSGGPTSAVFDPRLTAQHRTMQRSQSEVRTRNQPQVARGARPRSAKRNNAPPHASRLRQSADPFAPTTQVNSERS